jgi:Spy/CpxP family protein refolding chaperone
MEMGDMALSEDESLPLEQRFIEAMISHHEGAVHMAAMALEQAEHEEIRTLAEAIITAQEAEIEQMQSWLEEWYGGSATSGVTPSPYTEQLATPVRGLGAEEVDDLLAGRGMGFARMAELNSYPGPRHLLDLQAQLALTPAQVTQIDAAFQAMQRDAQALGREIVLQEQALSDAFATGTIDSATLETQVSLLGEIYAQLRNIHLQAHLNVTPLLTDEQIARYNELRGYTDPAQDGHHHEGQH